MGRLYKYGRLLEVLHVLIGEFYWQGQNGKIGMISATEKAAMQFRIPCKLGGISCLAATAKHSRNSAVPLAKVLCYFS